MSTAAEAYERAGIVDAMQGAVMAAIKAVPYLRRGEDMAGTCITGEVWYRYPDGRMYYSSQPGFSIGSALDRYMPPIFYYAGCTGDRFFFPATDALTAGAVADMIADDGTPVGTREVVSVSETVHTPAGTFEACVRIRKTEVDGVVHEAWYKAGVGLVRFESPDDPVLAHKVLLSYEVKGGEGLLPVAVGNRWCYGTPVAPDAMTEVNEYRMETVGKAADKDGVSVEAVALSCFNYIGMAEGWQATAMDMGLVFDCVAFQCNQKDFAAAAASLRQAVIANTDRETVDSALSVLEYLDEKAIYDKASWRFCPSSTNISRLRLHPGDHSRVYYGESEHGFCDTGVWGTRGEENRIFGVKPFRYLQILTGTLWDDRWVAGYEADVPHAWRDEESTHIKVSEGGRIETPAGVFADTLRLTLTYGNTDAASEGYYFFRGTDLGEKDYWFAPGVGIVRFDCRWGRFNHAECLLTDWRAVAAEGEMLPFHIGNFWRYEEQNLTAEGYIARRDYRVLSGMGNEYRLADHQMFTFKGTVEAYEEMKRRL